MPNKQSRPFAVLFFLFFCLPSTQSLNAFPSYLRNLRNLRMFSLLFAFPRPLNASKYSSKSSRFPTARNRHSFTFSQDERTHATSIIVEVPLCINSAAPLCPPDSQSTSLICALTGIRTNGYHAEKRSTIAVEPSQRVLLIHAASYSFHTFQPRRSK